MEYELDGTDPPAQIMKEIHDGIMEEFVGVTYPCIDNDVTYRRCIQDLKDMMEVVQLQKMDYLHRCGVTQWKF